MLIVTVLMVVTQLVYIMPCKKIENRSFRCKSACFVRLLGGFMWIVMTVRATSCKFILNVLFLLEKSMKKK